MKMKKVFSILALCGMLMGFGGLEGANSASAEPAVTVVSEVGSVPVASKSPVEQVAETQEVQIEPIEDPSRVEPAPDVPPSRIVINTASRGLYYYNHGVKTRLYPIAIGAPSSPTPVGYYKIIEMEVNPSWIDPKTGKVVPSGPACPLGYRWIRFHGNYGIHGTNNEASVGTYVSNGCIRMFEKDVEELYDLVDLGTPVEITYNRVVVEKAYDDTVVYYIYPDGYRIQPLEKSDVETWLKGFGVDSFVSDEDIEKKIKESDGNPTYIAKAYEINIDGKKVDGAKAVVKDGITYLPAISMALATGTTIKEENGLINTGFGKAPAYVFKDVMFANADDSQDLYRLQGGINKGVYHMYTVNMPVKSQLTGEEAERHPWAGNNNNNDDANKGTTVIIENITINEDGSIIGT